MKLKGTKFQLKVWKEIKKIPNNVIKNPTYEKSKNIKLLSVIVALYSEIIIFGGVPIAVFIPPRIQAKAKGIKYLEGCHSIF